MKAAADALAAIDDAMFVVTISIHETPEGTFICEAGVKGQGPIGFPDIVAQVLRKASHSVSDLMRQAERQYLATEGDA